MNFIYKDNDKFLFYAIIIVAKKGLLEMKNKKYLSSNLYILEKEGLSRKKIFIYHDDMEILLADVKKITGAFCTRTVYDDNYIVVYSRGDMSNQIPLYIEAAYNIKNKSIVNLSDNKIRLLLEFMLICKKPIDVGVILEYINNFPLEIAEKDDIRDFVRYLTGGNNEISREEIIEYILDNYPELENYMNYTNKPSVIQYRNILNSFGRRYFNFHIMPQIVDLSQIEKRRVQSTHESNEIEHELGNSRKTSIRVKSRKK